MAFLLAFDEAAVHAASARFRRAAASPTEWALLVTGMAREPLRQSWCRRGSILEMIANQVGSVELRADVWPDSAERERAERIYLVSTAAMRRDLHETRMTVWFPNMSDEDAGCAISESDEYEILVSSLFVSGSMPSGLEALDGESEDATTNWMGPKLVRRLAQREAEEGLLATLAAAARAHFQYDWNTIREALDLAGRNGWAMYYFERGT